MPTGGQGFAHALPGYGNVISRYDKPRELVEQNKEAKRRDAIKKEAFNLWNTHYEAHRIPEMPPLTETSYDKHFAKKKSYYSKSNPFLWDDGRNNNPHPSEAFLCTHLQQLPGFYEINRNSLQNDFPGFAIDSSLRPEAYKVDGSQDLNPADRLKRSQLKQKHVGSHDEKVLNTFRRNEKLYKSLDNETAHAAEAWLKLANPNDRESVQEMLAYVAKKKQTNELIDKYANEHSQEKIKTWLEKADREKVDAAHRLFAALESGGLVERKSSTAFRYSPSRFYYDLDKFKPKPREYKISPEWLD